MRDEPIGYMLMMEDITREKRLRNTMSRYMSKSVVDKLMESGEAELGGIGRDVSVLFSDIRGFTSISERLGAKETVALLNEYFTDMVDIVFAHNGVLDKYIGDMIMAVFGSVLQSEEDASNAVMVGNKMMTGLHQLNRRRAARGDEPIRIGVGISTGNVVAGNIGSLKRMEYTVIGDRVNLAERLEGANKFYGTSILICDATWAAVKHHAATREIDLIRVRGRSRPVAIYEALGHHSEDSFPHRQEVLAAFSAGLLHYRRRDWFGAERHFSEALAANPGDGPSDLPRALPVLPQHPPPATGTASGNAQQIGYRRRRSTNVQLSSLLAHHARYRPHATAVVFEESRWSYREFNARVNRSPMPCWPRHHARASASPPCCPTRWNCSTSTGPAPASAPSPCRSRRC
jgi:adenylate cyclase